MLSKRTPDLCQIAGAYFQHYLKKPITIDIAYLQSPIERFDIRPILEDDQIPSVKSSPLFFDNVSLSKYSHIIVLDEWDAKDLLHLSFDRTHFFGLDISKPLILLRDQIKEKVLYFIGKELLIR